MIRPPPKSPLFPYPPLFRSHPAQPHPSLRSDAHRGASRPDLSLLVAPRGGEGPDCGPAVRRYTDRHRGNVADALCLAGAVDPRHRRRQPLRGGLRADRRDFPVGALDPEGGPGMMRRKVGSLAVVAAGAVMLAGVAAAHITPRSEEHTSELQSQSNLVCRLLL